MQAHDAALSVTPPIPALPSAIAAPAPRRGHVRSSSHAHSSRSPHGHSRTHSTSDRLAVQLQRAQASAAAHAQAAAATPSAAATGSPPISSETTFASLFPRRENRSSGSGSGGGRHARSFSGGGGGGGSGGSGSGGSGGGNGVAHLYRRDHRRSSSSSGSVSAEHVSAILGLAANMDFFRQCDEAEAAQEAVEAAEAVLLQQQQLQQQQLQQRMIEFASTSVLLAVPSAMSVAGPGPGPSQRSQARHAHKRAMSESAAMAMIDSANLALQSHQAQQSPPPQQQQLNVLVPDNHSESSAATAAAEAGETSPTHSSPRSDDHPAQSFARPSRLMLPGAARGHSHSKSADAGTLGGGASRGGKAASRFGFSAIVTQLLGSRRNAAAALEASSALDAASEQSMAQDSPPSELALPTAAAGADAAAAAASAAAGSTNIASSPVHASSLFSGITSPMLLAHSGALSPSEGSASARDADAVPARRLLLRPSGGSAGDKGPSAGTSPGVVGAASVPNLSALRQEQRRQQRQIEAELRENDLSNGGASPAAASASASASTATTPRAEAMAPGSTFALDSGGLVAGGGEAPPAPLPCISHDRRSILHWPASVPAFTTHAGQPPTAPCVALLRSKPSRRTALETHMIASWLAQRSLTGNFFSGLPWEAMLLLGARVGYEKVPVGSFIVREGQEADRIFLLLTGMVSVWERSASGAALAHLELSAAQARNNAAAAAAAEARSANTAEGASSAAAGLASAAAGVGGAILNVGRKPRKPQQHRPGTTSAGPHPGGPLPAPASTLAPAPPHAEPALPSHSSSSASSSSSSSISQHSSDIPLDLVRETLFLIRSSESHGKSFRFLNLIGVGNERARAEREKERERRARAAAAQVAQQGKMAAFAEAAAAVGGGVVSAGALSSPSKAAVASATVSSSSSSSSSSAAAAAALAASGTPGVGGGSSSLNGSSMGATLGLGPSPADLRYNEDYLSWVCGDMGLAHQFVEQPRGLWAGGGEEEGKQGAGPESGVDDLSALLSSSFGSSGRPLPLTHLGVRPVCAVLGLQGLLSSAPAAPGATGTAPPAPRRGASIVTEEVCEFLTLSRWAVERSGLAQMHREQLRRKVDLVMSRVRLFTPPASSTSLRGLGPAGTVPAPSASPSFGPERSLLEKNVARLMYYLRLVTFSRSGGARGGASGGGAGAGGMGAAGEGSGGCIMAQGDRVRYVYFILQGQVEIRAHLATSATGSSARQLPRGLAAFGMHSPAGGKRSSGSSGPDHSGSGPSAAHLAPSSSVPLYTLGPGEVFNEESVFLPASAFAISSAAALLSTSAAGLFPHPHPVNAYTAQAHSAHVVLLAVRPGHLRQFLRASLLEEMRTMARMKSALRMERIESLAKASLRKRGATRATAVAATEGGLGHLPAVSSPGASEDPATVAAAGGVPYPAQQGLHPLLPARSRKALLARSASVAPRPVPPQYAGAAGEERRAGGAAATSAAYPGPTVEVWHRQRAGGPEDARAPLSPASTGGVALPPIASAAASTTAPATSTGVSASASASLAGVIPALLLPVVGASAPTSPQRSPRFKPHATPSPFASHPASSSSTLLSPLVHSYSHPHTRPSRGPLTHTAAEMMLHPSALMSSHTARALTGAGGAGQDWEEESYYGLSGGGGFGGGGGDDAMISSPSFPLLLHPTPMLSGVIPAASAPLALPFDLTGARPLPDSHFAPAPRSHQALLHPHTHGHGHGHGHAGAGRRASHRAEHARAHGHGHGHGGEYARFFEEHFAAVTELGLNRRGSTGRSGGGGAGSGAAAAAPGEGSPLLSSASSSSPYFGAHAGSASQRSFGATMPPAGSGLAGHGSARGYNSRRNLNFAATHSSVPGGSGGGSGGAEHSGQTAKELTRDAQRSQQHWGRGVVGPDGSHAQHSPSSAAAASGAAPLQAALTPQAVFQDPFLLTTRLMQQQQQQLHSFCSDGSGGGFGDPSAPGGGGVNGAGLSRSLLLFPSSHDYKSIAQTNHLTRSLVQTMTKVAVEKIVQAEQIRGAAAAAAAAAAATSAAVTAASTAVASGEEQKQQESALLSAQVSGAALPTTQSLGAAAAAAPIPAPAPISTPLSRSSSGSRSLIPAPVLSMLDSSLQQVAELEELKNLQAESSLMDRPGGLGSDAADMDVFLHSHSAPGTGLGHARAPSRGHGGRALLQRKQSHASPGPGATTHGSPPGTAPSSEQKEDEQPQQDGSVSFVAAAVFTPHEPPHRSPSSMRIRRAASISAAPTLVDEHAPAAATSEPLPTVAEAGCTSPAAEIAATSSTLAPAVSTLRLSASTSSIAASHSSFSASPSLAALVDGLHERVHRAQPGAPSLADESHAEWDAAGGAHIDQIEIAKRMQRVWMQQQQQLQHQQSQSALQPQFPPTQSVSSSSPGATLSSVMSASSLHPQGLTPSRSQRMLRASSVSVMLQPAPPPPPPHALPVQVQPHTPRMPHWDSMSFAGTESPTSPQPLQHQQQQHGLKHSASSGRSWAGVAATATAGASAGAAASSKSWRVVSVASSRDVGNAFRVAQQREQAQLNRAQLLNGSQSDRSSTKSSPAAPKLILGSRGLTRGAAHHSRKLSDTEAAQRFFRLGFAGGKG